MKSLFLLLSGICIFLATMSKGLPGIFPVVFFIFCYLLTREITFFRSLIFTIILLAIPAAIYALLMVNENADASLRFYLFDRLIYRISEEPVVNSRFYIVIRLFSELIVPVGLLVILFFFSKILKSTNRLKNEYFRVSLVFLGVALAGSLPLMLTEVQRGFYLTPSLPLFALCLGLVTLPYIKKITISLIHLKSAKVMITIISVASLIFSFVYTGFQKGETARDTEMLKDVYLIGKYVPEHSVVTTDFSLYSKWNLHFYFIRYFDICFTPKPELMDFLIIEKGSAIPDTAAYNKIELGTTCYELYKKNTK